MQIEILKWHHENKPIPHTKCKVLIKEGFSTKILDIFLGSEKKDGENALSQKCFRKQFNIKNMQNVASINLEQSIQEVNKETRMNRGMNQKRLCMTLEII